MEKDSIGIMYCVKGWAHGRLNLDEKIAEFLRQLRDTQYRYKREDIVHELREAVADFFLSCNEPRKEVRRYLLDRMSWETELSEYTLLIRFISGVRAKDLPENPCADLPIFQEEEVYE